MKYKVSFRDKQKKIFTNWEKNNNTDLL